MSAKRLARHALALSAGPLMQLFVIADMCALGLEPSVWLREFLVFTGAFMSGVLLIVSVEAKS